MEKTIQRMEILLRYGLKSWIKILSEVFDDNCFCVTKSKANYTILYLLKCLLDFIV